MSKQYRRRSDPAVSADQPERPSPVEGSSYVPSFEEQPVTQDASEEASPIRRGARRRQVSVPTPLDDVGYLNDETKEALRKTGQKVLTQSKSAGVVVGRAVAQGSQVAFHSLRKFIQGLDPTLMRKSAFAIACALALGGGGWLVWKYWPVSAPTHVAPAVTAPVVRAPEAKPPVQIQSAVVEAPMQAQVPAPGLAIEPTPQPPTPGASVQASVEVAQVVAPAVPAATGAPAKPKPKPVARVSAPIPTPQKNDDAKRRAAEQSAAMDAYFKKLQEQHK